jgi:ABC-2 type transport system permease protein
VFKGALRVIFTFVFPLAVMTTFPAQALLGTLTFQQAVLAIGGGLVFAILSRAVWKRALALYTSASS